MPAPQYGDHLYDLVFKANQIVQPIIASNLYMKPNFGDHLYDLVYKLDQNLANVSGSSITPEAFEQLDLSSLPTSDPGGGKPWLNGGVVQVGP